MEKRVLLAIVLAFLVLYLWQALVVPPPPAPGRARSAPSSAPTPAATAPAAAPSAVPPPAPAPGLSGTVVVGESSERDIRVETRDVVAVFTNRGARLKSWRLKPYRDRGQNPLELVEKDLGGAYPLPFSLRMEDEGLTRTLNDALYAVDGAPADDAPITSAVEIAFEYRDSAGLHALKRFRLEPVSYVTSVTVSVANSGDRLAPWIDWGPGLGDADDGIGSGAVAARGLFAIANEVTRVTGTDVKEQATYRGDFQYAGVDDHYFMSAVLAPGPSTIRYEPVTLAAPSGAEGSGRQLMAYTIEPGAHDRPLRVYIGPKDFDLLASIDRDLVRAIDFGMFAVIVVPLLRTLNWIYGYIGNYGWAIIVLTLAINVLMFPLRHKQVVSMRKMQEIQPEVKAIQERYAKYKTTDPSKQKMNQELMALYRERGVNPAAGCLPMLLPLPVFFAFYALLYTAIELRGAHFVGWIHDLSQPDPYYVTPIVMVVTQVLQTWMMPSVGTDPLQQKMMMIMPIVLGFIFLTMPAGVVVYWVVNNIWAIGQQVVTNRLIGPPKVRSVRPAAERRVKPVGSGKSGS